MKNPQRTISPGNPAWHAARSLLRMNHNVGFLLDMDGVIYRGATISPGASDIIDRLRNHGIPFRFLDLVPDEFIFENLAVLAQ